MLKNKKMILIVLAIIIIITGFIIAIILLNNEENQDVDNNTQIGQGENYKENEIKSYNDEPLEGLNGDTLDYYWNIDTSKFNSTMFDGNIYFFGATINGKINTNKLKEAGIEVDVSLGNFRKTNGIWIATNPKFSINTNSVDPNSMAATFDTIYLCDYKDEIEIYSDDTLISIRGEYFYNLTGRNIFPKQLGVTKYQDITVDLVLEKLGNPTYVLGRKSKTLENLYTYTTYMYVYDDVAFLYSFYNWDNMKLASVFYYPIEELNGTITTSNGNVNYLEQFETDYREYLKSK